MNTLKYVLCLSLAVTASSAAGRLGNEFLEDKLFQALTLNRRAETQRDGRSVVFAPRGQRSLLNTFPFNQNNQDESNHIPEEHHEHEDAHVEHTGVAHPVHHVHTEHAEHAHAEHAEQMEHAHEHEEEEHTHEHEIIIEELVEEDRSSGIRDNIAIVPFQDIDDDVDVRDSRQGDDDIDVSFSGVAAAAPGADGKKCIDKVEMVEETEYDEIVQCDHSYDKRCHTTYVTNYEAQQEEECNENFRKSCFIDYAKIAFDEVVEICRKPLVKDCEVEGPEVCRTEYESECWTKQEEHDVEDDVVTCTTEQEEKCDDIAEGYTTFTKCSKWPREVCSVEKKKVKKYTPITGCTKEPREICAPAGCGFKEGEETCYEKTQTVVQDAPQEECSLEPQRTCAHVTKLVPKLTPSQECVDVPKEVCTRSRTNPRKVKKPVVKKWCYVPTVESGLA